MGEEKKTLPVGWAETKLSEITSIRNEKIEPSISETTAYISLKHIESGTNRIKDHGASDEVKSLKSVFHSGDVLYGKLRPYLNKVCQPNFDGVCSTDILVFKASPAIENRFLLRLLSRKETVDYANRHSKGINLPRVSSKQLGELEVSLPPLNEQKRIVARIEELQAHSHRAREVLDSIPDLIEQLRQSVLSAAFRGDLTKKWREKQAGHVEPASELLKRIRIERRKRWESAERKKLKAKGLTGEKLDTELAKRRKKYKEPATVDTTGFPGLPEGWCWASLEELSDSLQYGSSSKSSKSGRIPVIRMGNLQNGEIDWSDLVFSSNNREIMKYTLAPNTVLFNRTNSPNLVGKTAIYRGSHDAIFAGYLIRIQNAPQIFAPYLNIILNSPFIKRHCSIVKSDAVSQSNINATKLGAFPIPLCPENEQELIISIVEPILAEVRNKLEWMDEINDRLGELNQSILTKAFHGELVPQDPNDEPASVLLDRIQQEKVLAAANQKAEPKQKSKKMKRKKQQQRDILSILRKSKHAMTPEDVFAAGSFDESSVDEFYEQLRNAVAANQIREIRNVDKIELEAIQS